MSEMRAPHCDPGNRIHIADCRVLGHCQSSGGTCWLIIAGPGTHCAPRLNTAQKLFGQTDGRRCRGCLLVHLLQVINKSPATRTASLTLCDWTVPDGGMWPVAAAIPVSNSLQ